MQVETAIQVDQSRASSGMRSVRIQSVNNSKNPIFRKSFPVIWFSSTELTPASSVTSIGDIIGPLFDMLCERLKDYVTAKLTIFCLLAEKLQINNNY